MTLHDLPSHLGYRLVLCAALTLGAAAGCDAGRPPAAEAGAGGKAAQPRRGTGVPAVITLDEPGAEPGLNGTYGDGQRTLRFETVRQPIDRGAVHPPLQRDYYIALRLLDATGRTFLILSEDKVPDRWLQEQRRAPGGGQPAGPELSRLALEAAQAVKQLELPRDLQPEQALLAQQLAHFGSRPMPFPPGAPPPTGAP